MTKCAGYQFGRFRFEAAGRLLFCGGKMVPLPPKVAETLLVLVENAGQVVKKDELLQKIWPDTFVEEGSLARAVSALRRALGDSAEGREYVLTIPKRGYRFAAAVAEAPRPPAPSAAEKVMLAVLPFENLSGDEAQEYFGEGLTDEMITQLGRLHPARLGVIARTSAMKYKHAGKGIDQIGRELGVQFVLEGSVRRAANRVRITAQLIQVSDQTHLWAESYDRDLRDILALQSDVARAIAQEIRIRVTPEEQARLSSARRIHPGAYEAYLKGRYFWNRTTVEGVQKGIRCFKKAVRKDPSYAVAYTGLADSYLRLLDYQYLKPKEAMAKAKAAAAKALEMDETLAEAHTSLGHAHLHEGAWSEAEREFERAIELNPSYATAHFYYANYLAAVGRREQAITEAQRAQELDPVSPAVHSNAAGIFFLALQYDRAIAQSRTALEMEPNFARAHYDLGWAYQQKGMYGRAVAAFRKAATLSGRAVRFVAALGYACGVAGRRSEARKLLKKLKDRSRRELVSPYDFAVLFLGLGDKDQAFAWLWKAYEDRAPALPFLRFDPRLDALRSDRRFQDLVRRMSFPK